jgi:hypothetical protein
MNEAEVLEKKKEALYEMAEKAVQGQITQYTFKFL